MVAPPDGFGDLADRVPSPEDGGAQIRVERYGTAEDLRWIVYVGGTVLDDGGRMDEDRHNASSTVTHRPCFSDS